MSAKSVCEMSCGTMHEFALVLDKAGFDAALVQEVVNSKGNKMAKAMFGALKPTTTLMETVLARPEPPSLILKIDRTRPFNSADTFPGLTIWKGTADKFDPEGQNDQDLRSLALAEIDFSRVDFKHHLLEGELHIVGEVALDRAKKSSEIRLDPAIGEALWLDYLAKKKQSVLEAIFLTKKITWFELLTPLRVSNGRRCMVYFCRHGGRWYWNHYRLVNYRYVSGLSASLAS